MNSADVCVVTPAFNAVDTIDETILSVLTQAGDFHLWYHVQDAGSVDGTVQRLERWSTRLRSAVGLPCLCRSIRFTFASEPDSGMYDGINRAFSQTDGRVMGWINADDLLAQGAIQSVWDYLKAYPHDSWVGGRTALIRHDGVRLTEIHARSYSSKLIRAGLHCGAQLPFIQQEGIFWRRELWQEAGGRVDASLRLAGDFELWTRFAAYAQLVSLDVPLAAFRVHPGQKTSVISRYLDELRGVQQRIGDEKADRLYREYLFGESFAGIVAWYDREQARWVRLKSDIRGDSLIRHGRTLVPKPTWEIYSGADVPEGPYPELGLNQIIRWMLGTKTVFRFRAEQAGSYDVRLMLRNYHQGQKVLVVSENHTLASFQVPKNDNSTSAFVVSFSLTMRSSERTVEVLFSKVETGRSEKRPLSCALLGIEIVPVPETPKKRHDFDESEVLAGI
jgi:glycosyltransferase involved in cell wall biosynthesis